MTVLFEASEDQKKAWIDLRKAMSLPVGAASPLWLMFAGAASMGVAYWWLSRWRTPTHLEAMLAPSPAAAPETPSMVPEVIAPAIVEAFEAFEAAAEAEPEPVLEAAPEPVVAPTVEAVAEPVTDVAPAPKPIPKPKTKAAAVRAAPRTTSGPPRRT